MEKDPQISHAVTQNEIHTRPSYSRPEADKGTCPVADRLLERSILLAIPSCLTSGDEQDIVQAFRKVLGRHG
jgi:dTDP-4-amino-4,6-dideoxygalactose transaminase